jgi:integrase
MAIKSSTRPRAALTHRLLESIKAERVAFRIPDARCKGLAVRVAPSGTISFDLAFRVAKSNAYRRISLGIFPDLSLEAARDRANDFTRAARGGRDLIAEEAQTAKADVTRITLRELAEEYVTRRITGRLRTAAEIERRINRTIAAIADRYADDIRRRDLRDLLDVTADAGLMREVDQRRVCLNNMFGWALAQDYITINPTAGLQPYGRSTPRKRVLTTDEIRSLWQWLATGPIREDAADVLRVQLALGARVSEVGSAHAEEFDIDNWIWTLPAARSKNKKPRVTPIVGIAREIIAARIATRKAGPLFITQNGLPIGSMHMCITLRDNRPPIPNFVTHDLRRTCATQMAETLGIALDTIARVLGHTAGGSSTRILTAHYVSAEFIDQKRTALLAWDAQLRSIISGEEPASNILAISDRRNAG